MSPRHCPPWLPALTDPAALEEEPFGHDENEGQDDEVEPDWQTTETCFEDFLTRLDVVGSLEVAFRGAVEVAGEADEGAFPDDGFTVVDGSFLFRGQRLSQRPDTGFGKWANFCRGFIDVDSLSLP